MMNVEMDLAKRIRDGSLELICPEMELLVCPSYDEVAMKGVGVIRADSFGCLYFRISSPFTGKPHPSLWPSKRPGEVYEPEDHVMLKAIDEVGREWRSNWLIMDVRGQIPLPNYNLQKNMSDIFHFRERQKIDSSFVRVLIPRSPSMPFDTSTNTISKVNNEEVSLSFRRDRHIHQIDGAKVTFCHLEDDWLSVTADRSGPFTPSWPGLICHALEFATAQTIRPALVMRAFNASEHLQLCAGPFRRSATTMPGPVRLDAPEAARDFWRIVELFFAYLENLANKPQFEEDSLLDELSGIRRGAQGSFQTSCLTLAVGIESIANLLLRTESTPKLDGEVIASLIGHLDQWSGELSIKERVKGAVRGFSGVSAADLMYAWADRTETRRELVDNWKKLRHPKAHGSALNRGQVGVDLYYSAIELMYRIIASAIGYDGPIIPTSVRGWTADGDGTRAQDG